jgi:hypothetical protein
VFFISESTFLVEAGFEVELWNLLLALIHLDEVHHVEVLVAQVLELQLEPTLVDSLSKLKINTK